MHVKASVTVNRSPHETYRYWRDFANLPRFMQHLDSVQVTSDTRSHWRSKAPLGRSVEWDAEIVADQPGEHIGWRSLKGANVANEGAVRFAPAPGDRGTEVRVDLRYDPPGGALGDRIARLFGEHPDQQVRDDLRRFKQVLETGEVVRSGASPEGTNALRQLLQRPGQPIPADAR